jgi:hypothetical protein
MLASDEIRNFRRADARASARLVEVVQTYSVVQHRRHGCSRRRSGSRRTPAARPAVDFWFHQFRPCLRRGSGRRLSWLQSRRAAALRPPPTWPRQRQSAGVSAGAVVAGVSRWCLQRRALGIAVGDPVVAGLGLARPGGSLLVVIDRGGVVTRRVGRCAIRWSWAGTFGWFRRPGRFGSRGWAGGGGGQLWPGARRGRR